MIDYKNLRRINPEAARQAVLNYLHSSGGVSATARIFGINRSVVYDIQRRAREGDLADRSHAPHRQPARTPKRTENRVIAARNRTGFGYKRLRRYLAERGLDMPLTTIRKILKRNRHRLDPPSRLRARAAAILAREAAAKNPPMDAEQRAYIRRRALLDRVKSFYS
jgi:transposase-like protein